MRFRAADGLVLVAALAAVESQGSALPLFESSRERRMPHQAAASAVLYGRRSREEPGEPGSGAQVLVCGTYTSIGPPTSATSTGRS